MVLYSMYVCMYKSYLKKCFRVFFLLFYKKNPKNFSLLFIEKLHILSLMESLNVFIFLDI